MTPGPAAERLHPALLYHLVNTLEWPGLRPLQEAAVEPVADGMDCLLLAPTAGGKTEAAVLPLLTRMAEASWPPLSVLYVCPLRALLNDLEPRLQRYSSWLGRRCLVWHGDTRESARRAALARPPDLLLTTPESLEAMLISTRVDRRALYGNLRAVIVDEVHAFMGDDRGWHLLAVLERLTRLAGRPLQRIGLSATVGNPAELLARLRGSNAGAKAVVIDPPAASRHEPEVTLDHVGSIENAAKVLAALHRDEKRLVFCDSRKRVEELAIALRSREVETFVSHSSLAADERRRTERAFAEARACVIVATSTLELGIDVGDLDRVVQIDAPPTVSAFLQRLGRSGRRQGTSRNCLFLATDSDALLRAAALAHLWSRGWVEPVTLPAEPLHILAQQLLAIVLQEGRVGRRTWHEWLHGLTLVNSDDAEAVVAYMVGQGFLVADQDMLLMGPAGERAFGRRNFLALTSVFTGEPQFTVLHGRTEIGSVHPLTLAIPENGPRLILLGGSSWRVTHVDWARRRCHVQPSSTTGRARWRGNPQVLGAELCQAMREVVLGVEPAVTLTRRAQRELLRIRHDHRFHVAQDPTVVIRDGAGRLRWWTWAGGRANASLSAALPDVLESAGRADNLSLRLRDGAHFDDLRRAIREAKASPMPAPDFTEQSVEGLKLRAALPMALVARTLSSRLGDAAVASRILAQTGPVAVAI